MNGWGVRLNDAIDAWPGDVTVAVCVAVILLAIKVVL